MKKLLFSPGPTNVADEVMQSLLTENMTHRDLEFTSIMRRVTDSLLELSGGEELYNCIPFASSGTGVNEAILSCVHGKILVLVAGRYSQRLVDIVKRLGIPHIELVFKPLEGIDLSIVSQTLASHKDITHMTFVHHETTTGILAPLNDLCSVSRNYGVISIVDTISSLFGHDIDLVRDKLDFCTVTSNKCLEGLPGVSFVIGRKDLIQTLKGASRSYYFDIYEQWYKIHIDGSTPFTMPIQIMNALDKATHLLQQEGVLARSKRYKDSQVLLYDGLKSLGFEFASVINNKISNVLLLIRLGNINYEYLREKLKLKNIVIYTDRETIKNGFFFMSTMGQTSQEDIKFFLDNVAEILLVQQL
jgi:2-aminoethylphosphonate-pyruvate transaminase